MSFDDTLAVVATREALLRALVEEPMAKQRLADSVDTSRSTVDRGLRSLETHGLVERDGGYRVTTLGRHLLAEYDRYTARAEAVVAAQPVLDALPDGIDLPTELLLGATVFRPRPNDPYGPLEEGMGALASADHVRSVVDSGLIRYAELFDGGLLPAEGGAELCLPQAGVQTLLNDRPEWFERAIERPDVELLEVPAEPPYSLAVVTQGDSRSVVFGVFDDRGVGSGLFNHADRAVEWASSFHDDWWAEATVVSPAER